MSNTHIEQVVSKLFARADELQLEHELPSLSTLSPERLNTLKATPEHMTSSEYEALCHALVVNPASMYRQHEEPLSRAIGRFRTAFYQSKPTGLDLRHLLMAAESGRTLAQLMAQLNIPLRLNELKDKRALSIKEKPWQEGYKLGEQARLALSPHPQPLFNIEELLIEYGVHIIEAPFSAEEIDAASLWEEGSAPVIILNSNSKSLKSPARWRTTLAHELCHLLHDADDDKLTTHVSWGAEGKGDYELDIEKRARAFAPSFLAPSPWVKDWVKEHVPTRCSERELVYQLASHWGLSFEGAMWHAYSCEIITPQQVQSLKESAPKPWIDFTRFKTSLTPSEGSWGARALTYIQSAAEEGIITERRADELQRWR